MSDSGDSGTRLSTPSSPPSSASSATSQIQVYARIRPSKNLSAAHFAIDHYSHSISLTLPPSSSSAPVQHADQFTRDYVNNQRLSYPFSFHGLFPPSASQDAIFNTVGAQCVQSLLDGYNSTIFAYGQTGSGKTYTITGGADSYDSRGIIPRTLSHLFDLLSSSASSSTYKHSVRVSYLEIYNDAGYDLLDRSSSLSSLSQLPKVVLLDDGSQRIHLQGLSEHLVTSVEDALELLFRGDTNRMICETPSNDASSRSHCLFCIVLESRELGGSKVRRSKLHLVDLAGSERIKKTQVTGRLFKEAAYINLSLHHLEQCILALHNRSQGRQQQHVPYRNSMMTSVLRDSLGGNCRTIMIANLSPDPAHLEESISTARFATRVGQVVNGVWAQEAEEDVEATVRRLRAEVRDLKDEVRRLRGDEGVGRGEALNQDERERCVETLTRWVGKDDKAGADDEEAMVRVGNEEKVRLYLRVLKQMILQERMAAAAAGPGGGRGQGVAKLETEVQRLSSLVQEKDAEIARLALALESRQAMQISHNEQSSPALSASLPLPPLSSSSSFSSPAIAATSAAADECDASSSSFEAFRQSYATNQALEQKKDHLRDLIAEAKQLGEKINGSRAAIARFKQILQARRVQRELRREEGKEQEGRREDDERDGEDSEEERRLVTGMEDEKRLYRERFEALKQRKEEIEHLKAMIERSRRKMQTDYERWKQQQQQQEPQHHEQREHEEESKESQLSAAPASPPALMAPGALSRLMMAGAASGGAGGGAVSDGRSVRFVNSTGNAQADADIAKFVVLRDKLLLQAAAIQGAVPGGSMK